MKMAQVASAHASSPRTAARGAGRLAGCFSAREKGEPGVESAEASVPRASGRSRNLVINAKNRETWFYPCGTIPKKVKRLAAASDS